MKTELTPFLPLNALPFLQKWLEGHRCRIKITRERKSKLGDYRLMPDKSHQITINGTLEPELFFFVMTHEVAHLLAFWEYKKIQPHGKEWKQVFGALLLESIAIYAEDLQPLIRKFAQNPKANFMSSPELVKYFDKNEGLFVEEFSVGEKFIYQSHAYLVEEKKKKRYLCKNLYSGKKYLFKSCARVEKLE